ncbi:MAG: type II secretion system GspH family protein, partial [Muribaculaceae bacterium]|nr:type II secretion system GspH family protein [Muribaculaceae bacterium]
IPAPCGRGSKGVGVTLDKSCDKLSERVCVADSGSIQFDGNTLRDKLTLIDSGSEPGMTKSNPPRNQRTDSFPRPLWERGRVRGQKSAFTLAEVLITLGIIGVVAAMTIPNLMTSYKAKRYRSQFLKSYSTIQQVIRRMNAEDVSTDASSYESNTFYKEFQKYMTGVLDCGSYLNGVKNNPLCHYSHREKGYKAFDKKTDAYIHFIDDGILVLQNGTSIYFENYNQLGDDVSKKMQIIFISVDINGFNVKPNVWGIDLFTFQLVDGELLPMGAVGTYYTNQNTYCNSNNTNNKNGISCAVKAKDNPDYFKEVLK